ncbi:MAG: sirohydrochlorin chelatase [Candidatus Hodgkinia cicadicola]
MFVFFIGHGSPNPSSSAEFLYVVDLFRRSHLSIDVGFWLLEFGRLPLPFSTISQARVTLIVPLILFPSEHVKHDIALVSNYLQSLNKRNLFIVLSIPCSSMVSASVVSAILRRLTSITPNFRSSVLLMVGRGSDAATNAAVHFTTRMVWEGAGFFSAWTTFSGSSFPLCGFISRYQMSPLVTIPLLLFPGDLSQRISNYCSSNVIASPLASYRVAVATLFSHIRGAFNGFGTASCNLCKHRLLCYQSA